MFALPQKHTMVFVIVAIVVVTAVIFRVAPVRRVVIGSTASDKLA